MNRELIFAYPGDLDLKTGGYAYDRRVIAGLRALGWTVTLLPLGAGFPFPEAAVREEAERRLSALADDALLLIDGLAFGVLDGFAAREADRLRIVALVHHPLALETGLDTETAAALRQTETRALSFARHVVVTSHMTADELVSSFGVARDGITTALPGTDPALPSSEGRATPVILSVGTLVQRKGHDILLAALDRIRDLDWTANIVGSLTLDPKTAEALRTQRSALQLEDRVTLAGTCDDTRALMASADIFALASRYEGYGMVFAEALSQGLPIVACQAGAVPEVVPEDAGILVPVDDIAAFAAALRRLLTDPAAHAAFSAGARRAGSRLPGWDVTAGIIAARLEAVS